MFNLQHKEITDLYSYIERKNNSFNLDQHPLTSDSFKVSGNDATFYCSTKNGSNQITISGDHDFEVGQGVMIFNAGISSGLSNPTVAPSITLSCRSGTSVFKYSYAIVNAKGAITNLSPVASCSVILPFLKGPLPIPVEYIQLSFPDRVVSDSYYLLRKEFPNGNVRWIPIYPPSDGKNITLKDYNGPLLLESTTETLSMPFSNNYLKAIVVSVDGKVITIDQTASNDATSVPLFHDNTVQIQNFFTTASGNRPCQLGMNDNDVMYVSSMISIFGNTNLKIKGSIKFLPIIRCNGSIVFLSGDNIVIRGGIFDGNRVNACDVSTSGGLYSIPPEIVANTVNRLTNCLIDGVVVKNSQNWGLNMSGHNILIKNCSFLDGGSSNEFYTYSRNCWVIDSIFSRTDWDGVFCFYGSCINCGAIRCFCDATISNGIGMYILSDDAQKGIWNGTTYTTSFNILFEQNVVVNASMAGLFSHIAGIYSNWQTIRNVTFSKNLISNCGTGISIWQSENVVVEKNSISNCGYGVFVASPSVTTTSNVTYNCGTGVGIAKPNQIVLNNFIYRNFVSSSHTYGIFNSYNQTDKTLVCDDVVIKGNAVIGPYHYPLILSNILGNQTYATTSVVGENFGYHFDWALPWRMESPTIPSILSTSGYSIKNQYAMDATILINNNGFHPISKIAINGGSDIVIGKMFSFVLKSKLSVILKSLDGSCDSTWVWNSIKH